MTCGQEGRPHLCKPLSSLILRDIALGDVFLEGWEQRPEQAVVLPEEPRLRNAAGVERGEGDARLLMQPPVHLAHCQHVAHLQQVTLLSTCAQLIDRMYSGLTLPSPAARSPYTIT